MRLQQQEEAVANRVKEFFANEPGFVFEKVAGTGAFGVILRFQNKNARPGDYQTIAVKAIAWSGNNDPEIQNLKSLKWAQHIVTIIQLPFKSEKTRWIMDNTIITEYLENGTLMDLKQRLGQYTHPPRKLPNRVLWAIFLCLVRGCVGIAYPPGDLRKTPRGPSDQLLETVPGDIDSHPPKKIEHGDLHEGNIMIGNLDEDEHSLFPVLKLIDFGLASEIEEAVEENIASIGTVMCELIWEARDINQLVNDKQGQNIQDPNLDPDLVMLAAQCIADDPASRPSLSRLLSVIGPKVQQKYPHIPDESDSYISGLVQRNVFDAS
ncbi:kinase-like domain-containing protein [Xylaria digitata]|nr:kinase-like domain-containing protein [Xylaria digitata]